MDAQARACADVMRGELDWALLHLDGWAQYEQARPTLPGDTIEVIVAGPTVATPWFSSHSAWTAFE